MHEEMGGGHEQITLAEKVYRALRHDIISGAIEAGQSLRLEYLKQRYGISFSPIREALNRLHSERLVLSTSSRGFRLAPFSFVEMWDAIETRVLIDCEALRRSLANADDRWEARLVGTFHALTLAAGRNAELPDQMAAKDILEARHLDFHQGLIAACGSPWLISLSTQLYDQTERYRRPTLRGRPRWGGSRNIKQEHEDLMNATLARDADRAAASLAEHYRETGRMIELTRKGLEETEKDL
jgi:DNA-binding GntR family transcriptional regulator